MDSFQWNTIAGWTLAATIAVLGLVIGTGEIFHPEKPEKPGYIVEGVEEVATAGPAKVADKPIEFYLASATPERGAEVFKKCGTCHNAEKGGPAGIGPNLYGVLGGPHAHMQGFGYSDAMTATHGKTWGWDEINQWLTSPKAYIPGNKMAFAGIGKPEDRAAVIVFLNSKSDKPLPVPPVPAETAAPAPAPAADAAAPAAGAPATPTTTPTSDKTAPQAGKAPDVPAGATAPAQAQGTSKTDPAAAAKPA